MCLRMWGVERFCQPFVQTLRQSSRQEPARYVLFNISTPKQFPSKEGYIEIGFHFCVFHSSTLLVLWVHGAFTKSCVIMYYYRWCVSASYLCIIMY